FCTGRGTRAEHLLPAIRGSVTAAVELSEGSGFSPQPRIPRRAPSELWGAVACWVCLQLEDGERARATFQLVAIGGAAAYAVCARCGQEAVDLADPAYRARVDRYVGARILRRRVPRGRAAR